MKRAKSRELTALLKQDRKSDSWHCVRVCVCVISDTHTHTHTHTHTQFPSVYSPPPTHPDFSPSHFIRLSVEKPWVCK